MMSADPEPFANWQSENVGMPLSRRTWLIAAVCILLAAAALRLVALHDVPPGLSQDEVLNADIVQFIRQGEHAFFFPYGFGHEPLYHYFSVPFQVLLGDNVLSIRLPAVVLGMLLVALTMRWARRDYGRLVGLLTGAGLAVSWWAIIFSRVGIRPILEPVLLVLAALVWPFAAQKLDRGVWLRGLLAAVVLGLSLYSYTAARVVFALPAGYLLYSIILAFMVSRKELASKEGSAQTAGDSSLYRTQAWLSATALLIMAALYLPLYMTLERQPDLQQRVEQLAGPLTALQNGDLGPVLSATLATLGYFGVTGDPRWTYGMPGVPLFGPVLALAFAGGLVIALVRWRKPFVAYALIWLGVALVPSAITPDAPSSVRLVGALPVVFLMPALLLAVAQEWFWLRRPQWRTLYRAFVVGLVLLVTVQGARTVRNGFVLWPAELETRLRYQTATLDMARLMNSLDPSGKAVPILADAFVEPIDDSSFQRDAGETRETRWIQSGASVAGALVWPGGAIGDADAPVWLLVPEFAPLSSELIDAAGLEEQPLLRTNQQPSVAVYQLPLTPPAHRQRVDRAFVSGQGENASQLVELVSYAMLDKAMTDSGGQALQLLTNWSVLAEVPVDLALFVHLVDNEGRVVAQHDGLDASAYFLRPNDIFMQRHIIDLPDTLTSEEYSIVAGVYQRNGQRLSTSEGSDWIELATCRPAQDGTLPVANCLLP